MGCAHRLDKAKVMKKHNPLAASVIGLLLASPSWSSGQQSIATISEESPACLDRKIITRLRSALTAYGADRFIKEAQDAVISGKCILLIKGDTVFVDFIDHDAGIACISRAVTETCKMTFIEAVEINS